MKTQTHTGSDLNATQQHSVRPGGSTVSESRGGISPPRAPRTVREPLGSYGSQCPAGGMQKLPVGEQTRRCSDHPCEPVPSTLRPLPKRLELASRPPDEKGVDPKKRRIQRRFVELAVIVDPATDIRVEHPRQVVQRHERHGRSRRQRRRHNLSLERLRPRPIVPPHPQTCVHNRTCGHFSPTPPNDAILSPPQARIPRRSFPEGYDASAFWSRQAMPEV